MKPHVEFLRFSQPSLVLNSHEMERLDKHVVVFDHFLQSIAQRFVQERAREPILEQCMNDGTPYTTQQRHALEVDGYKVVREAKEFK